MNWVGGPFTVNREFIQPHSRKLHQGQPPPPLVHDAALLPLLMFPFQCSPSDGTRGFPTPALLPEPMLRRWLPAAAGSRRSHHTL